MRSQRQELATYHRRPTCLSVDQFLLHQPPNQLTCLIAYRPAYVPALASLPTFCKLTYEADPHKQVYRAVVCCCNYLFASPG